MPPGGILRVCSGTQEIAVRLSPTRSRGVDRRVFAHDQILDDGLLLAQLERLPQPDIQRPALARGTVSPAFFRTGQLSRACPNGGNGRGFGSGTDAGAGSKRFGFGVFAKKTGL